MTGKISRITSLVVAGAIDVVVDSTTVVDEVAVVVEGADTGVEVVSAVRPPQAAARTPMVAKATTKRGRTAPTHIFAISDKWRWASGPPGI